MILNELMEKATFVVDAQGNKKAVLLDFVMWEELLHTLAELDADEEDEDVQDVLEIEARIATGQEPLYSHESVWAEIEALEAQDALPH